MIDPTLSRAERSVLRTLARYEGRDVPIDDDRLMDAHALQSLGLAERAGAGAYRITEEGRRHLTSLEPA